MNEFSEFVEVFERSHDFQDVEETRKIDGEIARNRQIRFERLVLILTHHGATQVRRLSCIRVWNEWRMNSSNNDLSTSVDFVFTTSNETPKRAYQ